jgi:serine/threonine protein phosphatase PrpC
MVTNAASRPLSLLDASNVIALGRIAGCRGGALPRTGRHGMRWYESDARAATSSCRAIPDHPGAPEPPGGGQQESEIWPEISSLDVEPGDTLLLCTDGLTKHLADAEIAELMAKADSAKEACASLIDAALREGGSDNVTVVVTRLLA